MNPFQELRQILLTLWETASIRWMNEKVYQEEKGIRASGIEQVLYFLNGSSQPIGSSGFERDPRALLGEIETKIRSEIPCTLISSTKLMEIEKRWQEAESKIDVKNITKNTRLKIFRLVSKAKRWKDQLAWFAHDSHIPDPNEIVPYFRLVIDGLTELEKSFFPDCNRPSKKAPMGELGLVVPLTQQDGANQTIEVQSRLGHLNKKRKVWVLPNKKEVSIKVNTEGTRAVWPGLEAMINEKTDFYRIPEGGVDYEGNIPGLKNQLKSYFSKGLELCPDLPKDRCPNIQNHQIVFYPKG